MSQHPSTQPLPTLPPQLGKKGKPRGKKAHCPASRCHQRSSRPQLLSVINIERKIPCDSPRCRPRTRGGFSTTSVPSQGFPAIPSSSAVFFYVSLISHVKEMGNVCITGSPFPNQTRKCRLKTTRFPIPANVQQ